MKNLKSNIILGGIAVALAVAFVPAADAATRTEVKRMIVEEAVNSRVPPALALAVAKVESDFQDNALSTAGARGVMQIMPKTARDEFGVHEDELWHARLNIQLGIDYRERLYDQYGGRWDLALSHYNGGTLKGGKGAAARPHSYTRKYVANVLGWKSRYVEQSQVWQVASRLDDAETWEPARTKVRETKVRRVLPDGRITFEDKQPEPVRITVREVPDRDPAVRWHDAPTPVSFEVPGFRERVERARKNLDDFSNGDPLRPGKRKAIVRWYDS